MKFTFRKKDKLKSQKLIERLFLEGKSVSAYPLRLVYLQTNHEDNSVIKAGVSVSKRNFKSAVDRNRIKRLLRETYRLQKHQYFNNITTSYALMILYIGKEEISFEEIGLKMNQLFKKFIDANPKS
ncbi:ribonuclease P protein component [Geojedonia litorea]|uniref:Ribonuclease P protein component n=1 Tax=Geojedonia litorea TaxID=1268269 RepID=A0ABV9N3E6_9FLAO